jgi:hypothetical protein
MFAMLGAYDWLLSQTYSVQRTYWECKILNEGNLHLSLNCSTVLFYVRGALLVALDQSLSVPCPV